MYFLNLTVVYNNKFYLSMYSSTVNPLMRKFLSKSLFQFKPLFSSWKLILQPYWKKLTNLSIKLTKNYSKKALFKHKFYVNNSICRQYLFQGYTSKGFT